MWILRQGIWFAQRFTSSYSENAYEDGGDPRKVPVWSVLCLACKVIYHHFYQTLVINNKQSAQNDTEFQITFDVFSLLSFALYNQNLSRHTLKTHMLNHTSEPKKCPYCEKISPTRNALTIHIRGNDDLSIMILFSTNPECFDLRCSHGTLAQVSLMWKSI